MQVTGKALALLTMGALILAGCSTGHTTASGSSSSSKRATTSTTPAASTSTTTSDAPQNQTATAAVKSQLTAAFLAHNGLPADEVAGTAPGSVFYAYLPASGTYWAIASFVPTASASMHTQVALQDEGASGIFSQPSGGAWSDVGSYLGEPCPGQIPAELETLWELATPGGCGAATTTTS